MFGGTRLGVAALVLLAATSCVHYDRDAVAPPAELGWRRTMLPFATPRGESAQLAALLAPTPTSGWLAVGTIFHGGGRSSLVIWRSGDATAWTVDYMSPPGALRIHGAARQGDNRNGRSRTIRGAAIRQADAPKQAHPST